MSYSSIPNKPAISPGRVSAMMAEAIRAAHESGDINADLADQAYEANERLLAKRMNNQETHDMDENVVIEAKNQLKRTLGDIEAHMQRNKEKVDGFADKQGELQARLLELEQKGARRGGGAPSGGFNTSGAQLRELLEDSAEIKAVADGKLRRTVLDLPSDFFNIKAMITSGGGFVRPEILPDIYSPPKQRLTIRALIPSIPVTSGAVQYVQETSYDNQAATVSETTQKPESNLVLALKTANVAVIAHWITASLAVLADMPQLQQYVETRLRYGLAFKEELQLLKGSGVGSNLAGLLTVATAYSRAVGGDTKIDALRRAKTQLEDTNFVATGIVLHPDDWETVELIKETTGGYVVGEPRGANPPTLWGLPVVPTPAMTAGTFLVADFVQSATILDREQARIDISTEASTPTLHTFITNTAIIRGEERIGLMIPQPGGLIKGTFA